MFKPHRNQVMNAVLGTMKEGATFAELKNKLSVPPEDFNSEEKEIWENILRTKGEAYFTKEARVQLDQYCRLSAAERKIFREIQNLGIRMDLETDPEEVKNLIRIMNSKMTQHTRYLSSSTLIARNLRLTLHSQLDCNKGRDKTKTEAMKALTTFPWEEEEGDLAEKPPEKEKKKKIERKEEEKIYIRDDEFDPLDFKPTKYSLTE